MNRGQMIFELSRMYGLDDTAGTDELTLMQTWLQRGIIDILEKTRCYVDIGTMALQAGVTDYRIDSNILAVDNITVPDLLNNPRPLDIVSMLDLLPYLSTVVVSPDAPWKASVEGTLMRVAPAPTTAITLTYFYTPKPTDMTLDANDPSSVTYGGIPTEYHDAILMFGSWKASEYNQQGGGFWRGHAYAPGAAQQGIYDARVAEIRKEARRKAGRSLSAGHVGYPDRQAFPTRNDTYPNR